MNQVLICGEKSVKGKRLVETLMTTKQLHIAVFFHMSSPSYSLHRQQTPEVIQSLIFSGVTVVPMAVTQCQKYTHKYIKRVFIQC